MALLTAFFLRSSSLPTGISSQHLFLACCGSLVATAAYLIFSYRLSVSTSMFAFMLLTLPSLLAAEDAKTSAMRWFGWAVLATTAGPLFCDEIRLKLKLLHWTRKLVIVCTIGSLILNLFGVRLAGRGVFFGLMGHTMLLAPVSALAAIDLFSTRRYKQSKVHMLLIALCVITCIGAGSRGAVVGLTFGILMHVAHRREGLYVVGLAAVALVVVSFIQLNRAEKIGNNLGGSVYAELANKGTNNTRSHLWQARIDEYKDSPVTGVGFQQQRIFRAETEEKFLEPGSSYLAVLSMTGTIGAIGFVVLCCSIFNSLFSSASAIPDSHRDLLRGWMAFFCVHFVIEGYIFACGSLLCYLFWLTAGCSIALHHQGRRARMRTNIRNRQRIAATG